MGLNERHAGELDGAATIGKAADISPTSREVAGAEGSNASTNGFERYAMLTVGERALSNTNSIDHFGVSGNYSYEAMAEGGRRANQFDRPIQGEWPKYRQGFLW